jgi:uroporphyrinogen-III synthase
MHNKIPILCTRPVSDELLDAASEKNIGIDVFSFIETEPIESVEVQQEIENALLLSATVVFTSMNAVEAVAECMEAEQPAWQIYCIGNTTKELVTKYFGRHRIVGTADDAAELADLIVAESEGQDVIFFCGDRRRDALPEILRRHDIEVNEIVVYETIAVPHKITKDYFGILFFSPSAVDSFFSVNKLMDQTVLFAIGNTTAETIKKYSSNKVIISGTPGKDNLVERMMEYFGG